MEPMTLADKYQLNLNDEHDLVQQNLVQLIYTTGKFENLSTNMLDTASIINNEQVQNAKPEDIVTVVNLKRAYQYVLNLTHVFGYQDVLALNNIIQGGIPGAGQLRTDTVQVPLTNDLWIPPIPDKTIIPDQVRDLLDNTLTTTEKAIDLNLWLSRRQLFNNGNKRTAMVAANGLMIQANTGILAIPENKMHWYRLQLAKYYRPNRDRAIKQWLYTECIFGI